MFTAAETIGHHLSSVVADLTNRSSAEVPVVVDVS
jgi:hypothetical protein